jgi:mRNA interferase MazF
MKQGEIWDINPALDKEVSEGRCSVIIINDDTIDIIPTRVIVPLTEWQDKFEDAIWLIRIDPNDENNLDKTSAVDAFQLHTIPTTRFRKKIGMLSVMELANIKNAVKAIINAE